MDLKLYKDIRMAVTAILLLVALVLGISSVLMVLTYATANYPEPGPPYAIALLPLILSIICAHYAFKLIDEAGKMG